MPKPIKLLAAGAPFVIVGLMGWAVLDSLRLLNWQFEYIGPKNELPEDVYGFGFAAVWLLLLLPFALLCCLSRYLGKQDDPAYWAILLGSYLTFSLGGFWLDHIVWPQLIH